MTLSDVRFGKRLLLVPHPRKPADAFQQRVTQWKIEELKGQAEGKSYAFFKVPDTEAYCVLTNDVGGRKDALDYFASIRTIKTKAQTHPNPEEAIGQNVLKLQGQLGKRPSLITRLIDWILRRKPIEFSVFPL